MARQYFILILFFSFPLANGRTSAAEPDDVKSSADASVRRRAYEQHALIIPGDAKRGRALFLDQERTKCNSCHRVNEEGGRVGPDLSAIGGKFDRPHLIESLLEPSRQIVEGYRTTVIALFDGRIVTGVIQEQSEERLTLVDAQAEAHTLNVKDIDARMESSVSIMPEGLAGQVTAAEFTDLIAYLETLRPGGKPKPGAGVIGPISVPRGFDVRTIATGLTGATALEVLPDGRVLLCEQTGAVRVIQDGRLLDEPFVTLPVDKTWERGVIGVTVAPEFPKVPFVYVCWVAKDPYPHHRVSRFTANGNVAVEGSERLLLVGDDQRTMGGSVPAGHQGGALHFGPDGKLYIGIGEQTSGAPSQRLDTFLGKILRINADGTIPDDNPFLDRTTGKYRAIWCRGARNPFTFAFNPADGMMLINDVGGKFEEINVGRAGGNYGWPVVDHGPRENGEFIGPIHWYPQASLNGGDFSRQDAPWPARFRGRYFFADFVHGWIKSLDPANPKDVQTLVTGLRRPVDLRFSHDGNLYVLLRNAWVIDDKFEGGTGSLLQIRYSGTERRVGRDDAKPSVVRLTEDAVDVSAGGLPAYKIETPTATYFLEKSGGGLSSLLDRDGNDWLGFHPAASSGAGGEYRGFPNAVYKEGGSYFHPRNAGTDPSSCRVEHVGHDRVSIVVESEGGQWAGRYEFFPTHCTFTMTRMPAERKYWVLYEGTPGGGFDPGDWWMTSAITERQPMRQRHNVDIPAPEWIAFGDANLKRALLLVHHEDDGHPDTFYQMNRQMTVFGFGRRGLTKHLSHVPQRFSILLLDSVKHDQLHRRAEMLINPVR